MEMRERIVLSDEEWLIWLEGEERKRNVQRHVKIVFVTGGVVEV